MALKTSQLIAFLRDCDESTDVRLNLNYGAFTRHRLCTEDEQKLWHFSYCDESNQLIEDAQFLDLYPDELGEIWTVEPE